MKKRKSKRKLGAAAHTHTLRSLQSSRSPVDASDACIKHKPFAVSSDRLWTVSTLSNFCIAVNGASAVMATVPLLQAVLAMNYICSNSIAFQVKEGLLQGKSCLCKVVCPEYSVGSADTAYPTWQ